MNRATSVMIIGASGAGKTTLSQKICHRLNLGYIHAGNINTAPNKNFLARQKHIATQVKKDTIKSKKTIIVDGHNCIKIKKSFFAVPYTDIFTISPKLIILIDPPYKKIYENIEKDKFRKRNISDIKKDIALSRINAMKMSRKFKTNLKIFKTLNTSPVIDYLRHYLHI
jgi:adenylate kinase